MKDIKNREYIFFDVETTGLSPSAGDRIVEIAALKIKNLKPVDEFSSFINPRREISYGAFMVNGITPEMLEDAPHAKEILPRFVDFIGNTPLIGHHVRFDIGFLNNELALLGMNTSDGTLILDTLKMARGLLPGLGRYSLQSLAYALGINIQQQHRAMADVTLTYKVFCHLIDIAQEKSITDIDTLGMLFGNQTAVDHKYQEDKIAVIDDAIKNTSDLKLSYFSARNALTTSRTVTPKKIVSSGTKITLMGFCHLRKEERGFRLDRILCVQRV